MSQWTQTHPGAGDAESIRRVALTYRQGAEQLRMLTNTLHRAPDRLAGVWNGSDSAAWASSCKADAAMVARSANSADEVASVWLAYADALGSIADRERRLLADPASAADEPYRRQRLADLADERRSLDAHTAAKVYAAIATGRAAPFGVAGLAPSDWSMSGFTAHAASLGDKDASLLIAQLASLKPDQLAEMWSRLSEATKRHLIRVSPEVVGNLEGIPYTDRDTANVSRLEALRSETLAAVNSSPLDVFLRERLSALDLLLKEFGEEKGREKHPPQFLISLDSTPHGQPLAAISLGDLDKATNATWFVPGMNSSLAQGEDYLRLTSNLQESDPDKALVLFLDYRSPGALEVPAEERAQVGADRLGGMLDGYNATRTHSNLDSRLNVIGHSYGTVVVSLALRDADRHVDAVVFVASAGIPRSITVSSMHVDPSRVYATRAPADWVAPVGQWVSRRKDPTDRAWGARIFGSDGEALPDGRKLDAVDGHDAIGGSEDDDKYKYFGPNTESIANILGIMAGDYQRVTQ
ncbi:alpha/beta hydrolase [Leifsonia sp. NPDC058292]|uniref:alpha/beta hydrolase n=1 Tax=Leifsonia sp. NPDC058292 TaxID=3346428 RepID=UPI0036DAF5D0